MRRSDSHRTELANVLARLSDLQLEMPSRVLFIANRDIGDSMYNADTAGMLFEHIRQAGPRRKRRFNRDPPKPIKSDTISGMISTLPAVSSTHLTLPTTTPL